MEQNNATLKKGFKASYSCMFLSLYSEPISIFPLSSVWAQHPCKEQMTDSTEEIGYVQGTLQQEI